MSVKTHDLDAERAVLSAVLIDNDRLEVATGLLTAEMFYRDAHQRIWHALQGLAERKSALDLVTLRVLLEQRDELETCGGAAYLASLVDGVPRATNLEHYAGIVKDYATRRALAAQCRRLITEAEQRDVEAAALLDAGMQGLLELSSATSPGDPVRGAALISEALAWLDEVEARRQRGGVAGVATGLADLDEQTDGFQPGQLIVIGARPSEGKTALALQIALAAGSSLFFSLEMSRKELTLRAMATLAKVDGWRMKKGYLSRPEQARVSAAMDAVVETGVAIDDTSVLTVPQIRAKARREQVRHGLRMVVVDYLQLITPAARVKGGNREQDVAQMGRQLKEMARALQVPVVALSQLNRAVEARKDKEPTLADLRESGSIEQDSDVVILLHRPDGQTVAQAGPVRLLLRKNRGGPQGTVDAWWYPESTRFAPAPSAMGATA